MIKRNYQFWFQIELFLKCQMPLIYGYECNIVKNTICYAKRDFGTYLRIHGYIWASKELIFAPHRFVSVSAGLSFSSHMRDNVFVKAIEET